MKAFQRIDGTFIRQGAFWTELFDLLDNGGWSYNTTEQYRSNGVRSLVHATKNGEHRTFILQDGRFLC